MNTHTLKIKFLRNQWVERTRRRWAKWRGYRSMSPEKWIRASVRGKSFVDIGAMWGVHGAYSFLAEESGARQVVAVDLYPVSKEFLEESRRRQSLVKFVRADINRKDALDKIGAQDILFCKGVLYHQPDPVHFLLQLRRLCKKTIFLGTAVIPEVSGLKNMAVFYPHLSDKQRMLWRKGKGRQRGLSAPHEPDSGYGNWFWGLTPSCVESMLNCAGFEVVDSSIDPFLGFFVCKPHAKVFSAVSGEWTIPSHYRFKGAPV